MTKNEPNSYKYQKAKLLHEISRDEAKKHLNFTECYLTVGDVEAAKDSLFNALVCVGKSMQLKKELQQMRKAYRERMERRKYNRFSGGSFTTR